MTSSWFLPLLTTALLIRRTACLEPYTPPPDRANIGDFCARNDHYTDPKFTCCASKKYDAPSIYTDAKSSCWNRGGSGDKIVKSAWEVFKCLVDGSLSGKPLNFENLADVLSTKLPSEVKSGIKTYFKINLTNAGYTPYSGVPELKGYENYANAWNAYYVAENWACSDLGTKGSQRIDVTEDSHLCYNWIDQGTRRGDCCGRIPIPFQLIPDPVVDRYYALKNWTATHLLTHVGKDYNWKNTTIVMYSDNVATCLRTAMFIQQGIISETDFKKTIDDRKAPDYSQIVEALVPKWMGRDVRDKIKMDVGNETALNLDSDIQALNDTSASVYQFVYADEWNNGRYNENATRFLFWNCRAHNLIMRRYKDSPMSEFC